MSTAMLNDAFRLYKADELAPDGYPPAWHRQMGKGALAIKVMVRLEAGNRCVRCLHPYRSGEHGNGKWSPCDDDCRHGGPVRWHTITGPDGWTEYDGPDLTVVGPADSVEARWRILTVHHLDGNKANCRWWNLAALCQRCHLRVQGKVQMARVWPWEHSDWFKPYVAGYYAWAYRHENLTRFQVLAELDELLGLERAA